MSKRFEHLGQTWEAVGAGTGHSVGFGNIQPEINRWGVVFRSISKPEQGDYRGTISKAEPCDVSDDELKKVLEELLVIAAIDRSNYRWRTAQGIAKQTSLSLNRVQHILGTTSEADVIEAAKPNDIGHTLFSTRNHFVKTSGDVSKRYKGVEESS